MRATTRVQPLEVPGPVDTTAKAKTPNVNDPSKVLVKRAGEAPSVNVNEHFAEAMSLLVC